MSPPPVGALVVIWAATRVSENRGSARNPRLVPVWSQAEYRGIVKAVDDRWLTMENGDRVRVNDISAYRVLEGG